MESGNGAGFARSADTDLFQKNASALALTCDLFQLRLATKLCCLIGTGGEPAIREPGELLRAGI